jgi:hypothetical protein
MAAQYKPKEPTAVAAVKAICALKDGQLDRNMYCVYIQ